MSSTFMALPDAIDLGPPAQAASISGALLQGQDALRDHLGGLNAAVGFPSNATPCSAPPSHPTLDAFAPLPDIAHSPRQAALAFADGVPTPSHLREPLACNVDAPPDGLFDVQSTGAMRTSHSAPDAFNAPNASLLSDATHHVHPVQSAPALRGDDGYAMQVDGDDRGALDFDTRDSIHGSVPMDASVNESQTLDMPDVGSPQARSNLQQPPPQPQQHAREDAQQHLERVQSQGDSDVHARAHSLSAAVESSGRDLADGQQSRARGGRDAQSQLDSAVERDAALQHGASAPDMSRQPMLANSSELDKLTNFNLDFELPLTGSPAKSPPDGSFHHLLSCTEAQTVKESAAAAAGDQSTGANDSGAAPAAPQQPGQQSAPAASHEPASPAQSPCNLKSKARHTRAEQAANGRRGHNDGSGTLGSGGLPSTELSERESGVKSQKSSGNPAVQVSRQIYNEFKDYVAGSRLMGADKGWPLGKLLQMAIKHMQAFMSASPEQHGTVMEKFANFQRSRRQKLPGSSLARSGIRLPTSVLLSLKDMLRVEDVDVWGMRRFLIEFLLASSMGQVDGLPAWLDRTSPASNQRQAVAAPQQAAAVDDARADDHGWPPDVQPSGSGGAWAPPGAPVKMEHHDMHPALLNHLAVLEEQQAQAHAQALAQEARAQAAENAQAQAQVAREAWDRMAVASPQQAAQKRPSQAYSRDAPPAHAAFRGDGGARSELDTVLGMRQDHALALSSLQERSMEQLQGLQQGYLGHAARGAVPLGSQPPPDALNRLLHSLEPQMSAAELRELSGSSFQERHMSAASYDLGHSLAGGMHPNAFKRSLLSDPSLAIHENLPYSHPQQGAPPSSAAPFELAPMSSAPTRALQMGADAAQQFSVPFALQERARLASEDNPAASFLREKRFRSADDHHLSEEYTRDGPGPGRFAGKTSRARTQRSRKPNTTMGAYAVPSMEAKRQKVSPNTSMHFSGDLPPPSASLLTHMHSTAHSVGSGPEHASPAPTPPPGRPRKNPMSMKAAAGMLMSLSKPGNDIGHGRGHTMRTRRTTGDWQVPIDPAPRKLPTPEKLLLERDALFSALRMRLYEPRPGKTGPKDSALTQHVQRIMCQSGMADVNVVRDAANNITHLRVCISKGAVQVQLPTYGLVGSVREGAMLCALMTCYLPSNAKRLQSDPPTEMRNRARHDLEIVSNICVARLKDVEVDVPLTPPDAADASTLKSLEYPSELRSYVTMFRLMDAWRLDPEAAPRLDEVLGNSRRPHGGGRHSSHRASVASRSQPALSMSEPMTASPPAQGADAQTPPIHTPESAATSAGATRDGESPEAQLDVDGPRTDNTLVLGGQVMDRSKVELGQLLRTQVSEKESEINILQELVDQVQTVQTVHGVRVTLKKELSTLEENIAKMQAKHAELVALRDRIVAKLGPEAEDKTLDAVVSKIVAVTESLNDDMAYMLMGARTMMPEKLLKYFFPNEAASREIS